MYRTVPFALSIITSALVITLILSAVVASCTFFMIGLQNNFGRYYVGVFTNFFFVEIAVILTSLVVSNHVTGIIVVLAYVACGVMVEGYFMVVDRISWIVRWLAYVTPQRYIFRAIMRNEYETPRNFTQSALYPTGEAVLRFYFENDEGIETYWADIGISWIFTCVNMVLLVLVLRRYY